LSEDRDQISSVEMPEETFSDPGLKRNGLAFSAMDATSTSYKSKPSGNRKSIKVTIEIKHSRENLRWISND